jgi:hypothetical protein
MLLVVGVGSLDSEEGGFLAEAVGRLDLEPLFHGLEDTFCDIFCRDARLEEANSCFWSQAGAVVFFFTGAAF